MADEKNDVNFCYIFFFSSREYYGWLYRFDTINNTINIIINKKINNISIPLRGVTP